MTIRLQRFDEHRSMPWKNGLGVTREVIAVAPEDGSVPFLWRVSMATVNGSGPFSPFPGVDRTIAVMNGDGMRLNVDGKASDPLTPGSDPFSFSGDAVVEAESLGGETLDLNVMTLRGRFRHTVRVAAMTPSATATVEGDHGMIVFVGRAIVTVGERQMVVATGDVLLGLAGDQPVRLAQDTGPAKAFLIGLSSTGT